MSLTIVWFTPLVDVWFVGFWVNSGRLTFSSASRGVVGSHFYFPVVDFSMNPFVFSLEAF